MVEVEQSVLTCLSPSLSVCEIFPLFLVVAGSGGAGGGPETQAGAALQVSGAGLDWPGLDWPGCWPLS